MLLQWMEAKNIPVYTTSRLMNWYKAAEAQRQDTQPQEAAR